MADQPNIVLVHGAWADGSSWSAAIENLQASVTTSLPHSSHWRNWPMTLSG